MSKSRDKRISIQAAKAKGRRLQVDVAEAIAARCNLTIEAVPPTKAGMRNGALWVPEGSGADLGVRRMGEAGSDVPLLTGRARASVQLFGRPLWVETKNTEQWDLGPKLWESGISGFIAKAYRQAMDASKEYWEMHNGLPIVVLSKNFWQPIVAWVGDAEKFMNAYGKREDPKDAVDVMMIFTPFIATTLNNFLKCLTQAPERA
jgi:hypothetical protein